MHDKIANNSKKKKKQSISNDNIIGTDRLNERRTLAQAIWLHTIYHMQIPHRLARALADEWLSQRKCTEKHYRIEFRR